MLNTWLQFTLLLFHSLLLRACDSSLPGDFAQPHPPSTSLMPQPDCTLMLATRDHIHKTACPDARKHLRGHSSAMEKAGRDIGENLTGESQQCRNSYLPNEPCDGKPDTTNPGLVLKVKIQNSKENDFIEIELHRQELSYQKLLQVSCCELGIHPEQVEKMRKLPNTLLRKDKDIQRL